jgi:hypothetical protein
MSRNLNNTYSLLYCERLRPLWPRSEWLEYQLSSFPESLGHYCQHLCYPLVRRIWCSDHWRPLSEKPRNATTQWHRPSVCKVPRLGATFVFSVIFAGCKLIGVCFPLKCDFWEFYGFAKGGCCGSRDCCARRDRRLTRMSVGLTLNGGRECSQMVLLA